MGMTFIGTSNDMSPRHPNISNDTCRNPESTPLLWMCPLWMDWWCGARRHISLRPAPCVHPELNGVKLPSRHGNNDTHNFIMLCSSWCQSLILYKPKRIAAWTSTAMLRSWKLRPACRDEFQFHGRHCSLGNGKPRQTYKLNSQTIVTIAHCQRKANQFAWKVKTSSL